MSCELIEKDINGVSYKVRQWGATKALKTNAELISHCGEFILPFIEGTAKFADILRLNRNVEGDVLIPLVKKFVLDVVREGTLLRETEFDTIYTGDLLHLYRVFSFVCEVQYKDFFTQGLAMETLATE